jgi:xanthine dehydrogenase iron-sulfur cluster and FAD-binding subunit A
MTKELLARHPNPTSDDIRHYLSGNLCRCATYPDIAAAVIAAAEQFTEAGASSNAPDGAQGLRSHAVRIPGAQPSPG